MAEHLVFIIQAYAAKPHRLVPQPAQVFHDEACARQEAVRLARFLAGVVVLAQNVDVDRTRRGRPATLAIHGQVPAEWQAFRSAA